MIIGIIVMAIISFANLAGFNMAGFTVIVGIIFYVLSRVRRQSKVNPLRINEIGTILQGKSIWIWIMLPLVMNIVCFTLAQLFLPEFIDHLVRRVPTIDSFQMIPLLMIKLFILALGEEIAWRGFFQQNLSKWLPMGATIVLTSVLFAIGHIAEGSIAIVSYDLFFIFINSMIYGFLYVKTNNLWMSIFSHFLANLFIITIIAIF